MNRLFKILTLSLLVTSFVIARGNNINSNKSAISIKVNKYYFDINDDSDPLDKKRSNKRRKIKRKPRRGRDNR